MGSFCCNYISYYHWSSLLFGICLADILWICQKAFTEWAPPVCLYQMCCILNFHWISSGYFHKIPLNPLLTRENINVIENVINIFTTMCTWEYDKTLFIENIRFDRGVIQKKIGKTWKFGPSGFTHPRKLGQKRKEYIARGNTDPGYWLRNLSYHSSLELMQLAPSGDQIWN